MFSEIHGLFDFKTASFFSKRKKCFKNPGYPLRNDLISTSLPHSSQKSNVIETGLSDFHKMTTTVIKVIFYRLKLSDLETEKDTHMKPATRELSDCIILIHLGINNLLPKKGA